MIALVKPKIKCIITQCEKGLATTNNDIKATGSRGEATMLITLPIMLTKFTYYSQNNT